MKKVLVIMVVCLLACSVTAFAGGHGKGGSYKKDAASEFYKKAYLVVKARQELSLTQEQVDAIKDLKYATKKELIMVNAEIDVLALDIKQALREDVIDVAMIEPLVDKKYDLKEEKAMTVVKALAALKTILTDEQKAYMKEHPWKEACIKKSGKKGSRCD